jgi:hypothetical protein
MRNRKLKKMIVWCFGFVVVLGIGGLLTANYAVSRVMDSFAAGLEADSGSDDQTPVLSGEQPSTPTKSAEVKQEKGVANLGKPTGTVTGKPTGTVTKEQAKEVQKNLTVSDKATVVSVILKSLNVSDMKKLRDMAKGGLTVEEKREAKELLLAKLSSVDYNELSALAKKYGISRGKTYDEAKQGQHS